MRNRRTQAEGKHIFGELFVFLLLGMFAVFSMMTVVVGANVYRSVVEDTALEGQAAIPLSYLANKIRGMDMSGAVGVESDEKVGTVLVLREPYEGDMLQTSIFAMDGALWEQFGYAEDGFDPELAERLIDVASFDAERTGSQVRLSVCMANGDAESLHVTLRSER